MRWVVQSNLGSPVDFERLRRACADAGAAFVPVAVVPFSEELPEVPDGAPTVFYGATGFIHNVHRAGRWRPGAYFDEERFRFSAFRAAWGEALLNAGAEVLPLSELARRDRPAEQLCFLRPDRDLKEFAGEVLPFGELAAWYERISAGGFTVAPDCPVVCAEPVRIAAEWRLFCVEGRVVSGSRYRVRHRLDLSPEVPAEVRSFGEALLARWSPAQVVVLDVGQSGPGLYAIEANCFNSAGFYAADVGAIVGAVTEHARAAWR